MVKASPTQFGYGMTIEAFLEYNQNFEMQYPIKQ